MSVESGAQTIRTVIQKALDTDNGALIGRNGTIEMTLMMNDSYNKPNILEILERTAGIYPISQHYIFFKWRDESIRATQNADVLATGWHERITEEESQALERWHVNTNQVPLRSLEPYYVEPDLQWTNMLKGHKVAVISSFTATAKSQVAKGSKAIWGEKGVLPDAVDWHWIQTGHPRSIAQGRNEWPTHIHSWSQAADHIVSEVVKSGARFAIIGCGGIGMPVAKMLKDRGIITIVMGGAIQVLFGIKGKRWQTHEYISQFWNDEWVWPSENETPAGASRIEQGCYWKP